MILIVSFLVVVVVFFGWFYRHQVLLRDRAHLMREAIRNEEFTFRLPVKGLFFGERALQEALNETGKDIGVLLARNEVESWQRLTRVLTHEIMNALANPRKGTVRERMGMVFGYVQSGKTAHYIGIINKAFDAGYRIVIVLSGIHNSLRSQTQSRIDEEVLGYETSLENI